MFLIQYGRGLSINAEDICTLNAFNPSCEVFFKLKNNDYKFTVQQDYEESFLNDLKTLDDNNPGNKLTKHNYR